ncbi:hypothetical protein EDB83DRAFT_2310576 [Lactarius deliciosus]|nr:hypothetical protein EDB83DRAFT_2310576 [Lactarius deliciosus]
MSVDWCEARKEHGALRQYYIRPSHNSTSGLNFACAQHAGTGTPSCSLLTAFISDTSVPAQRHKYSCAVLSPYIGYEIEEEKSETQRDLTTQPSATRVAVALGLATPIQGMCLPPTAKSHDNSGTGTESYRENSAVRSRMAPRAKTNRSARDWKGSSRVSREITKIPGVPASECTVEPGAVKEEGTGQGVPEEYGRCQGCKITRYEMIVKKGTMGQSEPRYSRARRDTGAGSTKKSV